MGKIIKRRRN